MKNETTEQSPDTSSAAPLGGESGSQAEPRAAALLTAGIHVG